MNYDNGIRSRHRFAYLYDQLVRFSVLAYLRVWHRRGVISDRLKFVCKSCKSMFMKLLLSTWFITSRVLGNSYRWSYHDWLDRTSSQYVYLRRKETAHHVTYHFHLSSNRTTDMLVTTRGVLLAFSISLCFRYTKTFCI